MVDATGVDHAWGICTKYLTNWFNLDNARAAKRKFIEIVVIGKEFKPSFTPDRPEEVFQIMWEYHTKAGSLYHQQKEIR
jgi:hypothetical protein